MAGISIHYLPFNSKFTLPIPRPSISRSIKASVSSQPRKTRRRKQTQQQQQLKTAEDDGSMASGTEKVLRLVFMEELMKRARNADSKGVSQVIYDMIAAGLSPGPRSFHGFVVSHVLNRDNDGAVTPFSISFPFSFLFSLLDDMFYFIHTPSIPFYVSLFRH